MLYIHFCKAVAKQTKVNKCTLVICANRGPRWDSFVIMETRFWSSLYIYTSSHAYRPQGSCSESPYIYISLQLRGFPDYVPRLVLVCICRARNGWPTHELQKNNRLITTMFFECNSLSYTFSPLTTELIRK